MTPINELESATPGASVIQSTCSKVDHRDSLTEILKQEIADVEVDEQS